MARWVGVGTQQPQVGVEPAMRWLGDGSHREQGWTAWMAVGLPSRTTQNFWHQANRGKTLHAPLPPATGLILCNKTSANCIWYRNVATYKFCQSLWQRLQSHELWRHVSGKQQQRTTTVAYVKCMQQSLAANSMQSTKQNRLERD